MRFTLLSLLWLMVPLAVCARPERSDLQKQFERCEKILHRSVIEFYLPHCLDRQHGGYLENLDANGKFVATGEKFLTLQARQLWFFSTLAAEGIRREDALTAARHGFQFIQRHFADPEHGGYFSKVADAGKPTDPRKHAYLNSFALYALAAYHKASGDNEVLNAAKKLFRLLDDNAHDSINGGYHEFFFRDWKPVLDEKASGYVGAINTKTYNTHLHLLESFAELYRIWPDERLARRLAELIQINSSTVKHPDFNCNIDGWHPNWGMVDTPRNLRASYGHDIECAWLTLDAARTIGWGPPMLRQWAVALCRYSLKHGYDREHGGFFYTGPLGTDSDDRKKEWWVQAEALVSMLELFKLTGEDEYYRVFVQTLDFIERHQVAPEGGWWATRQANGSPHQNKSRTSMWQGAYHGGRALILSSKLLKEFAKESR